ncbi:ABC transporter substrate-binding protein [Vagococcus fluvialis]|uniref:ABC transporter substrate-binding protein n=1 Tax=Vagococcus fluvialis TaxID=2738 RepID=UPI0037D94919
MKLKKLVFGTLLTTLFLGACSNGNKQADSKDDSVSGEITVLTDRTDGEALFKQIEANFIKEYPEVTKVTFENIADYDKSVTTRLNSGEYGDVLFIPFSMAGNREKYPNYFESLGTTKDLGEKYLDVYEADYKDDVYGLPVALNSLGIIYNEAVLKEAGITDTPTTTTDFIKDLEKIKETTNATPFYSNYQAVAIWAGALTSFGGEQFKSETLESGDAFKEGMPIREVMDLFYEMSSKGLIEKDPMTLDSQTAFSQLAKGEIAMLMHGSQEVPTIQNLTKDPIKIMNFPVETDGKTSFPIGAPAVIGINKHSKNKKTAEAFLDYFVSNKSGYVKDLNGMPNLKADLSKKEKELIDNSNVILTVATETPETNAKYTEIANEVGVARLTDVLQQVINIGLYPDKNISYEDYVTELSNKWTTAAKNHE